MASYYAKFCLELVGEIQKYYFIDPMTYVFSQSPEQITRSWKDNRGKVRRRELKRSYIKLVKEYGNIFEDVLTKGPLVIKDFDDNSNVRKFVKNVITFQKERLTELPEKYRKYAKYLEIDRTPPIFLVPPYFYIPRVYNSDKKDWLDVNLELAETSVEFSQGMEIYPVILTNINVIDKNTSRLIEKYNNEDFAGYIIWIESFKGGQDLRSLRIARDFISELSDLGKPIIMLYGDYFSALLSYNGLTGFSSGICYGESKRIEREDVIKGQIPPRYYFERLKIKKVLETETRRIDIDNFLECDCIICQTAPDIVTLDDEQTKEHFMLVRHRELEEIRMGKSKEDIIRDFSEAYDRYKNDVLINDANQLDQLSNWATLLSES